MKYCKTVLILAMLLAIPAGAQTSSKNSKGKDTPGNAAQARSAGSAAATSDPEYVIGEQDILNINVWKEPEVSGTVPVRLDGKISLPLIHDIEAAGQTPMQLQAVITDKLKQYIADPRVTIIVTTSNSKRVFLMGEVGRQGPVPMLPNMTVLQALASAGGFSQYANLKKIYVLRNEGGKQVRIPFNYKAVISGNAPEQNILLKPGDTIVVP